MPTFRTKPVVKEAWQFTSWGDLGNAPDWFKEKRRVTGALKAPGEWRAVHHPTTDAECLMIWTLEGVLYAGLGDWIIRGLAGELYSCKPDIFARTYEPVDGAT